MRQALQGIAKEGQDEHAGLLYDVWGPESDSDTEKSECLDRMQRKGVPRDYSMAFDMWLRASVRAGVRLVRARLESRLLIGHGNPSAFGVGLTLHRTWGVPVIPGTALKGLVAHYTECSYGPSPDACRDAHPYANVHPEPDRAPFSGVLWTGRKLARGPGRAYRALFGAPSAEGDEPYGLSAAAGDVDFDDALLIPPSQVGLPAQEAVFCRDVLTIHQKPYYDHGGMDGEGPNDFNDPIPVPFLSVRPGMWFLFSLRSRGASPELGSIAERLLKEALEEWGVGGKTAAGYGRFSFRKDDRWVEEKVGTERRLLEVAAKAKARRGLWKKAPEGRWAEVVDSTPEATLVEWVRIALEQKPDHDVVGFLDPPAGTLLEPAAERAAFVGALRETGFVAAWGHGKALKSGQSSPMKTGGKRLKELAGLVGTGSASAASIETDLRSPGEDLVARARALQTFEALRALGDEAMASGVWPIAALEALVEKAHDIVPKKANERKRQWQNRLKDHVSEARKREQPK